MKQKYLLIKNDYFKKVIKYFLLEAILLLVYLSINFENGDTINLTLGLNKITFYDRIKDIIKLINIGVIVFSILFIYFYDLVRSPEFLVLRERNKKYIIEKLILIFIVNVIINFIYLLVISLIFGQISSLDIKLILNGFINIFFTIFTITSLLNLFSQNKYIICFIIMGLFIYNLFFNLNIFYITIVLILFSFLGYSNQKIYNKFIR